MRPAVLSVLRLLAVTLVLGVAGPPTALAEDDSSKFSMSWTRLPGAGGCSPAKVLAARVEARLHRSVFGAPSQADVAVEGYITPISSGWKATVSIVDSAGTVVGTREIESHEPACPDLDPSIALTIALLIDPTAELAANSPPARSGPSPAAPTRHASDRVEPRLPIRAVGLRVPSSAPASPVLRSWTTLGGGVALALLPHPAPGLVLRLGIAPTQAWSIVVEGAAYREELQGAVADTQAIGFSLAYAGAALCPVGGERRRLGWRACGGLEAGVLSTRGLADGAILERHRFVASGAARLEGMVYLGHFLLAAGAALAVPLLRDSFDYERDNQRSLVFRPSPVGGTLDLSLGYRSP